MIRAAVPTDIHAILKMGAAFFTEAGWNKHAEFDSRSFAITCGGLMDNGVFLVAEKDGGVIGMTAAGVVPAWWNANVLTAQELFWYVDPAHRKGTGAVLMAALEDAVKSLGVMLFSMSAEEGLRGEALGRLYRQHRYFPMERLFWKQLQREAA